MFRKSLIIGANGQVGRQLVLTLGDERVVATGRAQIDLASLIHDAAAVERILQTENIEAIYCVGGATDVERCETDPRWAMNCNHVGPALVAKLGRSLPFVYFSSEYVFDGLGGPYTEASPKNPICVYGESKARGEEAILANHPGALIVRTTVVYGTDLGGKNFLYSLRKNLSAGGSMRVPADQISTPTYNQDLAQVAALLVRKEQQGIFHVCGPDRLSRYEFAIQSARILGLEADKVVGVPTVSLHQRARRPLSAGLVSSKLAGVLPHFGMRDVAGGVKEWLATEESMSEALYG